MIKAILRRCNLILRLATKAEIFLAVGQIINIFVPSSIFSVKKFYLLKRFSQAQNLITKYLTPLPLGFVVKKGDRDDIQALVSCIQSKNPAKAKLIFNSFFDLGGDLWYAKKGDQISGYLWLYNATYLIPLYGGYNGYLAELELDPDVVFVASAHVDESCRRIGIFSNIIQHTQAMHTEKIFCSCTEASNTVSLKTHKKLGFSSYGLIRFVRFFKFGWCHYVIDNKRSKWIRMEMGTPLPVWNIR